MTAATAGLVFLNAHLTVRYTQTCSNRVDTRADLLEQDPTVPNDRVLTGVNPARFRHFDHDPETIIESEAGAVISAKCDSNAVPLAEALAPYAAKTDARRAGRAVNR